MWDFFFISTWSILHNSRTIYISNTKLICSKTSLGGNNYFNILSKPIFSAPQNENIFVQKHRSASRGQLFNDLDHSVMYNYGDVH